MINEIFISRWDPVTPIPLMTPAKLDNELERIYENMAPDQTRNFKRHKDQEFDRGFRDGIDVVLLLMQTINQQQEKVRLEGWLDGYDKGYTAGRDVEARIQDGYKVDP